LRFLSSVNFPVGNQLLSKKVEDASQAIRRDIVFAASLYFE
jgi:superfamily II RNA helicase